MRIIGWLQNPDGLAFAPLWLIDHFPKTPRLRPGMKLRVQQDGAEFFLQETIETQTIRDGEVTEVRYVIGLAPAEKDGRQLLINDILEVV